MKNRIFLITLFFVAAALAVSCGSGGNGSQYEPEEKIPCVNKADCPDNYTCDIAQFICVPDKQQPVDPNPDKDDPKQDGDNPPSQDGDTPSHDGDTPDPHQDGDPHGQDGDPGTTDGDPAGGDNDYPPVTDDDTLHDDCIPGAVEECEYTGPEGTKNVGTCKAATRTCSGNGLWGFCEGEVWPVAEKPENSNCGDGLDNDCNGIADDGIDIDGDGHGRCSDCCETEEECADPLNAWNIEYDACDKSEASLYKCDGALAETSILPDDYAKAIGICNGLVSATILAPDGSTQTNSVHSESHKILTKLGTNIEPTSGKYMLAIGTGKVGNPFEGYNAGTSSQAPSDWVEANGGSFTIPYVCSQYSISTTNVHDAVMLELKVKVPEYKKSFSFDFFFLTHDFPDRVCNAKHDIFVSLLDSECNESSECTTKNPNDKNLAIFGDYLVNVNLTKTIYMTHCIQGTGAYINCQGASLLAGTGFDSCAGTGWLTIKGNVVDLETITLRLAIWDSVDLASDSLVLIDNFKWYENFAQPGIQPVNY